jgi:DNA processing protein
MDVLDTRLCLLLHSIPELGDRSLARLFHQYGSAEAIWNSSVGDWRFPGLTAEAVSSMQRTQLRGDGALRAPAIEGQLELLRQMGALVLPLTDPRYPALLQTLYDPPPILYVLGDPQALQQAQLGIVGSRRASPPGKRATQELAADVVRAGLHVTSGLAVGIDQVAHRAAIEAGGKTIAVMATGLDQLYPRQNAGLAREIVQCGALVSEFPPGARPLRARFPQRNRIISGLSLGVLVIEAALRSGSLITARTAMEQGREVFTLPWSIFHPAGRGCLNLLREGVKMVENAGDILEELGPLYQCQLEMTPASPSTQNSLECLDEGEVEILQLIGSDEIGVDEIVRHSGRPLANVLAALSTLEIAGRVVRCGSGYIHC